MPRRREAATTSIGSSQSKRAAVRVDQIAEIDALGNERPQQVTDAISALGVAASRGTMLNDHNRASINEALQQLNAVL